MNKWFFEKGIIGNYVEYW